MLIIKIKVALAVKVLGLNGKVMAKDWIYIKQLVNYQNQKVDGHYPVINILVHIIRLKNR